MSAHTPGPWKAILNPYSRYEIHYSGGQLAGVAKWDDPASPPPIPEMNANAILIAAAPELLEALRYAEAFIAIAVPSTARDREEAINEVLPAIRAAIAKATGNG